jgi:hypothetical protein
METFILANISDVLSTIFGLNLGGVEINQVINFLIEATSVPEALLVNRWNPRLLTWPTLALSVIAISNSLLGLRYL